LLHPIELIASATNTLPNCGGHNAALITSPKDLSVLFNATVKAQILP
jgi:hypothetical protein